LYEASFFRAIKCQSELTSRWPCSVALSVYLASGSVNNEVSRGRIRTAGQPIAYIRATCPCFRDNEY